MQLNKILLHQEISGISFGNFPNSESVCTCFPNSEDSAPISKIPKSNTAAHFLSSRLCDKIDPNNDLDKAGFFANTAGNFEDVVQYNKDNRAFEVILWYFAVVLKYKPVNHIKLALLNFLRKVPVFQDIV